MKYTKLNDTTLEVQDTLIVENVITKYTLDDLIAIRSSIDVAEAESDARYQAEKDKFDLLISEARKLDIKTQEELLAVTQ